VLLYVQVDVKLHFSSYSCAVYVYVLVSVGIKESHVFFYSCILY